MREGSPTMHAMKKLSILFLLFFTCSIRAEEASLLSGAQQAEQIIQKCTSPRWSQYMTDTSIGSDYHLEEIIKEEINCKERALMDSLKMILPEEKNREEVMHLYHEYKAVFLKMYGLISTKNAFCGKASLGCGTHGTIASTMLYNTALDNLITYTLQRQDGTY